MRSKRVGLALAASAAALVAGTAYASSPDAAGVIHGCHGDASGRPRVVDTAKNQHCPAAETAVDCSAPQNPVNPAMDHNSLVAMRVDAIY